MVLLTSTTLFDATPLLLSNLDQMQSSTNSLKTLNMTLNQASASMHLSLSTISSQRANDSTTISSRKRNGPLSIRKLNSSRATSKDRANHHRKPKDPTTLPCSTAFNSGGPNLVGRRSFVMARRGIGALTTSILLAITRDCTTTITMKAATTNGSNVGMLRRGKARPRWQRPPVLPLLVMLARRS
jgi:hypothetical protein